MESKEEQDLNNLRRLYGKVERLKHRKKTDDAYYVARDLALEATALSTTNHIRLDAKILDKYSTIGSDKSKDYVIEEFKENLLFDLRHIISGKENRSSSTE